MTVINNSTTNNNNWNGKGQKMRAEQKKKFIRKQINIATAKQPAQFHHDAFASFFHNSRYSRQATSIQHTIQTDINVSTDILRLHGSHALPKWNTPKKERNLRAHIRHTLTSSHPSYVCYTPYIHSLAHTYKHIQHIQLQNKCLNIRHERKMYMFDSLLFCTIK